MLCLYLLCRQYRCVVDEYVGEKEEERLLNTYFGNCKCHCALILGGAAPMEGGGVVEGEEDGEEDEDDVDENGNVVR